MLLHQFAPPANLTDFTAPQQAAWSKFLSDQIDLELGRNPGHHFYNPTKTDTAADVTSAEISWTAFPRQVQLAFPTDRARWQQADASRGVQDEYCEWSVTRDPATGKITRVTFTSEGPEYWTALARVNHALVLSLYQKFVSPAVKSTDLFRLGKYDPTNKWNNSTTGGAMHLIQGANTLRAEINIAVASTVVRRIGGALLTDERDLIECGGYGQAERFSDPHIGGEVNGLARQQASVTLADPIALYIRDLSTAGWATPDGSDPKSYWTIVRGTPALGLRAVYEVPPGKGFAVGDVTINGNAIDFAGQIADFITIKIVGRACRFGGNVVPDQTTCPTAAAPANVANPTAAMFAEAATHPTFGSHR